MTDDERNARAAFRDALEMMRDVFDCGSSSCVFATDKLGQRTNSGCSCVRFHGERSAQKRMAVALLFQAAQRMEKYIDG